MRHATCKNIMSNLAPLVSPLENIIECLRIFMIILSLSWESVAAKGYKLIRLLPELQGPIVKMCFTYPIYWQDNIPLKETGNFIQEYFNRKNVKNMKTLDKLTTEM